MTDNEIIKALECCLDISPSNCKNCPLFNVTNSTMVCSKIATKFALDLINRQKAGIEKNERIIRLADKTIETQKAEIERLKTNLNIEFEKYDTEYDNIIKSEAVKEFWELLKVQAKERFDYYAPKGCDLYFENGMLCGYLAMKEAWDKLLKEMVSEDKVQWSKQGECPMTPEQFNAIYDDEETGGEDK